MTARAPAPPTAPAAPRALIYRRKQVLELFGISGSTLRRWMDSQGFPRPRQLGPRTVGWPVDECRAWLDERPQVARPGIKH